MTSGTIDRRAFLQQAAGGLAGAAAAGLGLQACGDQRDEAPSAQRGPNIVIFVADDTGWNDVGYHGSEIRTPNIDRLAREGAELDHFYVAPTCSPTRAWLLTGRPPSRFGILGPIGGRSRLALPAETPTLPGLLRSQGYTTAITGKWHLGLRPEVGPRKYGFEHSYGYLHGQIDQNTHHYKNGDRSWHRDEAFIDEEGHATDLIGDEAIRFIHEARDRSRPFFLYVPFSVPHYPLQEPAEWLDRYRDTIENESRRAFAASLTHMDEAIGRVLAALESEGLTGETLVMFMSDNGGQEKWIPSTEYEGRHGPNDRLGDNRPLRGWKGQLYEGGIRVPAAMYWPGRIKPEVVAQVMCAGDIFPTLARLADAEMPDSNGPEGIDVWPAVVEDKSIGERVLYWRTGRMYAVRRGDWKLVHHGKTLEEGRDELFDLANDPKEEHDRAGEQGELLAEMRVLLGAQVGLD